MEEWKYETARDHGLKHRQRMRSLRREAGLVQWTLHHSTWAALRFYLRGRFGLRVYGAEGLPTRPPFLMVANHTSHLDALVLGASVCWRLRGDVFPIAAGDTFFETPTLESLSALLLNALPIWRERCGRHEMAELRRQLQEGCSAFILFPEGTRSRTGEMGRFKAGVGMLVAQTDVPVFPCHIRGAYQAWPADRKRPRSGSVSVRIGDPILFAETQNGRAGWLEVAQRLENVVTGLGEFSPE